jgi:hypothetical protein
MRMDTVHKGDDDDGDYDDDEDYDDNVLNCTLPYAGE